MRERIVAGIAAMTSKEAWQARLKRAGLPVPPKPKDAVEGVNLFSEWEELRNRYGGVSNIPYGELGDFLDRWSAMISYARWVEAVADIEQATAREIRDTIKKQLYTLQDGSREVRDALVHMEPLYQEWEAKYTETLTSYIAIKALREGYEHRVNAISREITRRGSDETDTRRAANRR